VQLSAAAAAAGLAQPASPPVLDTHVHLFDTTRPQGVPWPPASNAQLYQPALPARLRRIAAPLGVAGAIEVECSPWLEDNQWVLDVAADDPYIVGMIGNLEPAHPDFPKHLERFRRNPLFLGIRYGNLWGRDLGAQLAKPDFVAGIRLLAEANLTLDSANPNPALLEALLRLTDRVPELRLVIDHLPQMPMPADAVPRRAVEAAIREFGKRPRVYLKISEVLRRVEGAIPEDVEFYRARLDEFWEIFGEDRVVYGSDWPNSDNWLPYAAGLRLLRAYVADKPAAVAEKLFWKNSVAAYRWKPRDPSQPRA
jgi:predicted TIM-barrel fold metal-dependent hydrolase